MSDTNTTLKTLLTDTLSPNNLEEVAALVQYINAGCIHGDPLFLSLGETWEHTPHALSANLGNTPAYVHGYQLSMYGLPELRQLSSHYIEKTHHLESIATLGVEYDIALSWTGTRNAMYDFGRLLKEEYFGDTTPTVLTTAPGWDYSGVFGNLNYTTEYIQLDKRQKFTPSITDFEPTIAKYAESKALLIINAQHNPTSVNWSADFVRQLVKSALKNSFAILVDDAHYGVCHPDVLPTSSLAILLDELKHYPNYDSPWMAVRSLGKQFGINGWGLGVITASPAILDLFVNTHRTQHIYNYGGMLQYALAQWLKTDEPRKYLEARAEDILLNKQAIQRTFIEDFGYVEEDIFIGECTNFILFSVPRSFAMKKDGVKLFLDECLSYGIVLTDAWPRPYDTSSTSTTEDDFGCVRLFAGASQEVIQALLARLTKHKFHYTMEHFRNSNKS